MEGTINITKENPKVEPLFGSYEFLVNLDGSRMLGSITWKGEKVIDIYPVSFYVLDKNLPLTGILLGTITEIREKHAADYTEISSKFIVNG